jgi:hypothetical protein
MGRHTTFGITPSTTSPPTQLSGTTAQRPVLAASQQGVTFFNTDVNQLEIWNGAYWFVVGELPNIVVTSNTVTGSNHAYWVDTTGGAISLTLPSSPRTGDVIKVYDTHGNFGTNNCTVVVDGQPIMRQLDNMVISTPGAAISMTFYDNTRGWLLEAI